MHDLVALANRLGKNFKQRKKWAERQSVEAYRVYECDIPELRYIIDVYLDRAVVYDKLRLNDDPVASETELAAAVATALGFPAENIHLKLRRRMPGAEQYQKLASVGNYFTVREESSRYLVNLTDYLDTGLFLDHRPLRREFRRLLKVPRFLNLFCYTGSVSVAAAAAGARTTNVDMSNSYIDWAQRNFAANGLDDAGHEFIREDALRFLEDGLLGREPFDVIFLDPPTFSNSKKMRQTFDVQRDHRVLIDRAMKFLKPEGMLYFSTNRGRFHLEPALAKTYEVEDITERTIPEDFRDKKIHRCFTLSRPRP